MITLQTDINNDLSLFNGNLVIASDTDQIRQSVKEALGTFRGEWFLDNTIGVPWLQEILVDNVNLDIVQAILVNAILSVPGIATLDAFTFTFDNSSRSLSVSFTAKCTNGQTINQTQTAGI